jgi:hypothetical protein
VHSPESHEVAEAAAMVHFELNAPRDNIAGVPGMQDMRARIMLSTTHQAV